MTLPKIAHWLIAGCVLTAGCGGTGGGTSTASTPAPTPTPVPPVSTPAPTPTPVAPVILTATATVDGKSQSILVDPKGMTLYYFTPDKGGKVTCTGACLTTWPPLVATDPSRLAGGPGVTGTLGTVMNPNNQPQITYNTWPMYFYMKDQKPGDVTGQNVGGRWFVATPTLAA